jgi:hypothetical protein
MASGHVNRANRPNTWLHRPTLQTGKSPCQLGAVHTWHIAVNRVTTLQGPLLAEKRSCSSMNSDSSDYSDP